MFLFVHLSREGLSQILELEPVEESLNSSSQVTSISPFRSISIPSPPLNLSLSQSGVLSSVSPAVDLKNSRKTRMKWKSSHIQQNSTFDHGLNSVMDSPLGQIPSFSFRSKIKCRSFHRNSVLGPDLTELPISRVVIRKSPRLHGKILNIIVNSIFG